MALVLSRSISYRCMSHQARQNAARIKAIKERMLRVDHAGEYGAVRIYEGQIAVLGKTAVGPTLQHMKEQEDHHLKTFCELLPKHRVRPTALIPFWDVAGFALGAGTALLGKEGAMACTVAVETAIGEHYDSQIRTLMADGEDGAEKHKELIEIFKKFRDEELEHLETGLEHDAKQAPLYEGLTSAIKMGCKVAIWASERV